MNLRQTHESLGNLQAREGALRRLAMNRRSLAHFLVHDEHSMSEHMNAWMNKRNKEMLGWHGYRPKGNGCCGALYLGHEERSDESPLSHNRDSLGWWPEFWDSPFPPGLRTLSAAMVDCQVDILEPGFLSELLTPFNWSIPSPDETGYIPPYSLGHSVPSTVWAPSIFKQFFS